MRQQNQLAFWRPPLDDLRHVLEAILLLRPLGQTTNRFAKSMWPPGARHRDHAQRVGAAQGPGGAAGSGRGCQGDRRCRAGGRHPGGRRSRAGGRRSRPGSQRNRRWSCPGGRPSLPGRPSRSRSAEPLGGLSSTLHASMTPHSTSGAHLPRPDGGRIGVLDRYPCSAPASPCSSVEAEQHRLSWHASRSHMAHVLAARRV